MVNIKPVRAMSVVILLNTTAKASSIQETYCGFAVGNVIPKGTPVVLVAELKSESALTAVGYARTSLDMVHY